MRCAFVIFVLCIFTQGRSVNPCVLKDGAIGVCKYISDCTSAQKEILNRERSLMCGFNGAYPTVCCGDHLGQIQKETSKISEEKCQMYLNLNVRTTTTKPMMTTTNEEIGRPYAVGGVDARFAEFPHMAILGYGTEGNIVFQCGGSLISEQFVLTAAHCLESKDFGRVSSVRLGDLDIASEYDKADPQDFAVAATYIHPDYDFVSFYHDIALIKLDRPVVYTAYVKPACLQTKHELENDFLTATGWGALYYGGELHSKLQKVELRSLPIENCLPSYRPQVRLQRGVDEELQICAGNVEQGMDTCHGDSGGPLQLRTFNYWGIHKVVGVISFGNNCGLVPGIYARVSRYVPWIESIVWPN